MSQSVQFSSKANSQKWSICLIVVDTEKKPCLLQGFPLRLNFHFCAPVKPVSETISPLIYYTDPIEESVTVKICNMFGCSFNLAKIEGTSMLPIDIVVELAKISTAEIRAQFHYSHQNYTTAPFKAPAPERIKRFGGWY